MSAKTYSGADRKTVHNPVIAQFEIKLKKKLVSNNLVNNYKTTINNNSVN